MSGNAGLMMGVVLLMHSVAILVQTISKRTRHYRPKVCCRRVPLQYGHQCRRDRPKAPTGAAYATEVATWASCAPWSLTLRSLAHGRRAKKPRLGSLCFSAAAQRPHAHRDHLQCGQQRMRGRLPRHKGATSVPEVELRGLLRTVITYNAAISASEKGQKPQQALHLL